MKKIFIIILFVAMQGCYSQQATNLPDSIIKKLKDIKEMPYMPELSGDSIFWVIVMKGLDIVPDLIEKLDDTTNTNINIPNFSGFYTVADIANDAILKIIIDIPILDFVIKSKKSLGEYWYYLDYVRADINNRVLYKKKLKEWYLKNKSKLKWHKDKMIYKTSKNWKFKTNLNPAGGYYSFK